MINTIACISSCTDAFITLNIHIKVPSCSEPHFTPSQGCNDMERQVRLTKQSTDWAIITCPLFLAHIYLLMYPYIVPSVLTSLLLQRLGLNLETVPIWTYRPTNPQEGSRKVLSGMDGLRNWNRILNLQRKRLLVLTSSSEVRRERGGLNCFKV